jgi:adenylate cyclase
MNSGRERVERRLAAILATDVAGYSRLMGADEEGTHAALTALRHELSDPKIAGHRGRIVKTTGDGLLVEFASVVDAVRCAVEL